MFVTRTELKKKVITDQVYLCLNHISTYYDLCFLNMENIEVYNIIDKYTRHGLSMNYLFKIFIPDWSAAN